MGAVKVENIPTVRIEDIEALQEEEEAPIDIERPARPGL